MHIAEYIETMIIMMQCRFTYKDGSESPMLYAAWAERKDGVRGAGNGMGATTNLAECLAHNLSSFQSPIDCLPGMDIKRLSASEVKELNRLPWGEDVRVDYENSPQSMKNTEV